MQTKPTCLVISFSPLVRDARVLRQISAISKVCSVVSVGYGPQPPDTVHHLQISDGAKSLPQTVSGVAKLATHWYSQVEVSAGAMREALKLVDDFSRRQGDNWRPDVVVSNDARALPVAHRVAKGAPVWADMHEWAPAETAAILSWRLLVSPFMTYLCRKYLPKCQAVSAVTSAIAQLYHDNFGVDGQVMHSSARYLDALPKPVDPEHIKLVHSGGAVPGRSLELIIDVVKQLGPRWSIDFYLVASPRDNGSYLASLKERAKGANNIRFCDPVPPAQLPALMNNYDIGVFWIVPRTLNNRFTLPNKFFDWVQGRIAIAVGPSPEMAKMIERYDIGVVSSDFEVDTIVKSIRDLTPQRIMELKNNTQAAAKEIAFEHDELFAQNLVSSLLGCEPFSKSPIEGNAGE